MIDNDGKLVKSVFTSLTVDEISAVDSPAQGRGARVTIFKRAKPKKGEPGYKDDKLNKRFDEGRQALLSDTEGHQHVLLIDEDGGSTSWETKQGDDCGHTHPWIRTMDGRILIGTANDHTHEFVSEDVSKRALLLTPTDGHTHTLVDESGPGQRAIVGDTSWTAGTNGIHHSHPWVRDPQTGTFSVGEADGHTHNTLIDASPDQAISLEKGGAGIPDPVPTSKSNSGDSTADSVGNVPQGTTMSEKNEKTADEIKVAKQLEELTKRAERAEKMAELNDAQRGIFTGLDVEGQDEFLGLSVDQRDAQVAKAAEENAVVYTDAEGTEYRKSDDQRMVNLAKRADAERELRVKGEEVAKAANLSKRAEGFKHIVGGVEAATLILKGIDALPEADKAPALKALKDQDAAMAKAFVRKGTSEVPSEDASELDTIAKAILVATPTLTPEQAMVKALETPEGSEAYSKSLGY